MRDENSREHEETEADSETVRNEPSSTISGRARPSLQHNLLSASTRATPT